jgi:hypothetical protein
MVVGKEACDGACAPGPDRPVEPSLGYVPHEKEALLHLAPLLATLAVPAASGQVDLEAGIEILAVWGLAARATDRTHRGPIDALGLRTGFVTGPSPVFGDDRALGGLFAAGAIDLFHRTPWQLEITLGPAWVDHSLGGRALLDGFDDLGALLGVAGRIRTGGPFQMNVGLLLLADRSFEHPLVLADLSPGWQWGRRRADGP